VVRPGLTGWAQVKGGRDISPEDKTALDIWYVHNASLSLDFKILMYTVQMVIFGEHASFPDIHRAWQDLKSAGICSPGALRQARAGGATVGPAVLGTKPSLPR
jgi:hypothetical protein